MELVGEVRLAPFFVQGNASYQYSTVRAENGGTTTNALSQKDGRLPNYPTLQGHMTAGATLPQ